MEGASKGHGRVLALGHSGVAVLAVYALVKVTPTQNFVRSLPSRRRVELKSHPETYARVSLPRLFVDHGQTTKFPWRSFSRFASDYCLNQANQTDTWKRIQRPIVMLDRCLNSLIVRNFLLIPLRYLNLNIHILVGLFYLIAYQIARADDFSCPICQFIGSHA